MKEEQKIDLLFAVSFIVGIIAFILLGFNLVYWTLMFLQNKPPDLIVWAALIGFLATMELAFRLQDHIEARLARYWRSRD